MATDPASTLKQMMVGTVCRVQKREADWNFNFGEVNIAVSVPWRIVTVEGIAYGDEDDAQWFGLPQPVDGEARANELLGKRPVVNVNVDQLTADLRISLDGGSRMDLFNNSMAYEGWVADLPAEGAKWKTVVGMGGGGLTTASS
jgi:hypothetical protein